MQSLEELEANLATYKAQAEQVRGGLLLLRRWIRGVHSSNWHGHPTPVRPQRRAHHTIHRPPPPLRTR